MHNRSHTDSHAITHARNDTHTHTQRHSRLHTHAVDYGLNYIPYGPERLLPNKLQALTGAGGKGTTIERRRPPKDKENGGTHKGCRATALREGNNADTGEDVTLTEIKPQE